jgi:acyl carrier protein
MHSVSQIEAKIAILVSEVSLGRFSKDQVKPDQSILGDLGLDSLDYAVIMLGCEEWLQSKVDEASVDWRKVTTIHDLAILLYQAQQ